MEKAQAFAQRQSTGQKWGVYDDFRRMIDKEKLDAVMIETTTHPRAWIAILAMQAGMDAYIEKPMCLTIAEGRAMVNAARKYNRVTQVGTQQRSMPINNWASDLVKNGALGKISPCSPRTSSARFRWTKTSTKDVTSRSSRWWDLWTNQAELRPYDKRTPPRLGAMVGLRRRRPVLRRHRLGHPLLRPDQPRLGHRRHRPGRSAAGRAGRRPPHRQVRPAQTVGGVVIGDTGDIDTGTAYHGMAKLEPARGPK